MNIHSKLLILPQGGICTGGRDASGTGLWQNVRPVGMHNGDDDDDDDDDYYYYYDIL